MKKVYYQLKLTQQAPLRIGNGDNEITDSDLMLDGRGIPFVPGSSVAGVLRDMYERRLGRDSKGLFGNVTGSDISDSRVIVSDAVGPENVSVNRYVISERDGVGLDDWGVTIKGAKYNFQVVETDIPYVCILEWSGDDTFYAEDVTNGLDSLARLVIKDGISFGARTTRGYGHMAVVVKKKVFNYNSAADIENWLEFDPFDSDAFSDAEELECTERVVKDTETVIELHLHFLGGFSVRVRTFRNEPEEDGSLPDSVPLSSQIHKENDKDYNPVIPGTAWAGVFRHHMQDLLREIPGEFDRGAEAEKIDLLFGKSRNDGEHRQSSIWFNETEIIAGKYYSTTRNAVDRFTAAPKNTALFTEKLYRGGKGILKIRVEKNILDRPEYNLQKQLLLGTLLDINLGLAAVGGTNNIGHGLAEIEELSVDGIKRFDNTNGKELHLEDIEGAI